MIRHSIGVSILVALLISTFANAAQLINAELCVATYNLRFASDQTPNSWRERRPLVKEIVQAIGPDVMGTQEGVHQQLLDIAADLPDYDWIGVGREGGTRGEFMAIFYRKARLQPLATNHFWLSDTPEVVASATWGNSVKRMVTYVQFRDRETGVQFHLFNTHFDHQVELARAKSAELIRHRIEGLTNSLPLILLGDFNAHNSGTAAYETLTKDDFLKDTWNTAASRKPENVGTFNAFQAAKTNGPRIDWILTRGAIETRSVEIVTTQPNGKWASDHFPVVARMKLPARK
jgi:endonuclease/exonuclease/phosphatase family metal-dependent hydrolase